MDKNGDEKILSIWWFFVLAVIGGGIVTGVLIFYSANTNINSIESDIMSNKLIDCFIINGELNKNVLNDFNVLKECGFDEKYFQVGSFVYFNVSISNKTDLIKEFVYGNHGFENDCRVSMKISSSKYPLCVVKNYYADYNGDRVSVRFFCGSNQIGGKIS